MDWLSFLIQVALFYLVFKLGQWSVLLPMRLALEKLAREKGIDLQRVFEELKQDIAKEEDEAETTPVQKHTAEEEMNIERVEGIYYAYGADGRFLAQGTDFRTMFENIKNRFPGQNFRIRDYQAQFTEEEAGRLLKSVFEVFGKDKKS